MNAESVLVWTYLWCSPSGGYTPAHPRAAAAKWAGTRSELQACPALALSLNSGVKWSSRTPDSFSDGLIKTRPGRADEDCERSMKRFEEQLRSSSANKSAKQEHLERVKRRVVRMSVKEKVIFVLEREKSVWGALHGIKQKAWSMDPSVTSLKRAGTFIRYGALQYLYHEYFRVPSRSPDVGRSRYAVNAVARTFPFSLTGPEEKCGASSSSFLSEYRRVEK